MGLGSLHRHCKAVNAVAENSGQRPNISNLRPWKKGESGNPNGRRAKGFAKVEKMREALAKDLPDILKNVTAKALEGDLNAARLVIERVLPPLKAIEAPVLLGALTGTLTEQGACILRAMAEGLIAPGQATQLLSAISAQAKVVEVDDIARRLEALEKKSGVAHGQS